MSKSGSTLLKAYALILATAHYVEARGAKEVCHDIGRGMAGTVGN